MTFQAPKRKWTPIEPRELTAETEAMLAQLDGRWPRWNRDGSVHDYWSERMGVERLCWHLDARVID